MTTEASQEQARSSRFAARVAERVADLAALKAIWEGSPKYGVGALIEAFNLCTDNAMPLPPWLAKAVRAELIGGVPKGSLVHYRRWREVRKMRDARWLTPDWTKMRPGRSYPAQKVPLREISYDATFEWVAQLLEKRPSAGSAKTIRSSYDRVEKDLPEGLRYVRTHRKRYARAHTGDRKSEKSDRPR